jgi:hypothetical protein
MKEVKHIYSGILFFLLTPGVLVTLPSSKSSVYVIAAVHALIFSIILYISCKTMYYQWEGFESHEKKRNFSELAVLWVVNNVIGVEAK